MRGRAGERCDGRSRRGIQEEGEKKLERVQQVYGVVTKPRKLESGS